MESWERDGVKPADDWASIIFVQVFPTGAFNENGLGTPRLPPSGYIFVIEPARADPKFKLPGGHQKAGENPLGTAIRELRGETNVRPPRGAFQYVNSYWVRKPGSEHWSCLFVARVLESEVPWMNSLDAENEGEVPKYLTVEEFYAKARDGKFLEIHFKRLTKAGLILPLGREVQPVSA